MPKSPGLPKITLTTAVTVTALGVLGFGVVPTLVSNYESVETTVSTALAQDANAPGDGPDAQAEKKKNADKNPERPPATCWNEDTFNVLTDLRLRANERNERMAELEQKRAEIAAAQKKLARKTEELRALKEDLNARLQAREETAREDLQRLVEIYGNMNAEKAAAFMNDLTLKTAADIVERLDARDAATIMQNMEDRAGTRLTRELNRRREMVQGEEPMRTDDTGQQQG